MLKAGKYDHIRPYNDHEIKDALNRIVSEPIFFEIVNYFFPEMPHEEIISRIGKVSSIKEWQAHFMLPVFNSIIRKTATGLTYSGIENLSPGQPYLFISNHRDILLDSAILQAMLFENGLETTQVTFGNNLIHSEFTRDIGKINKLVMVIRDSEGKAFYMDLSLLSNYIRYCINNGQSVWIAQKNGRSKDGDDRTHTALLKMLNISGNGNLLENFVNLHIIPVTVSYEFEPCDALKTRELYLSSRKKYVKSEGEDLNSIITGIKQHKGRIHLAVGNSIDELIRMLAEARNENERIKKLAGIIDNEIFRNYRLWPNNYIACDLLEGEQRFKDHYTEEQKEVFIKYVDSNMIDLEGDHRILRKIFLKIYANPVHNSLSVN